MCEIVGASTTLVGQNPYGQVQDWQLLLSTKLGKVPSSIISIHKRRFFPNFRYKLIPWELKNSDSSPFADIGLDWNYIPRTAHKELDTTRDPEDDLLECALIEQLHMALVTSRTESRGSDSEIFYMLYGLVLLPTQENNVFQRIGIFETDIESAGGVEFWEAQETRIIKII